MKKRLFLIGLLSLILLFPVFGIEHVSVNLNGMPYTAKTPVIIHEHTPYVSLDELESLVLATVNSRSTMRYEIKIGKNTLEIAVNNKEVKLGQQKYFLTHPVLAFDQKPYVPITDLLDLIQYPYTWDDTAKVLTLTAQPPESMNSNGPDSHKFIDSRDNLKDYPKHLIAFNTPEMLTEKVQAAMKQNSYVAFVDSTHIKDVLDLSQEKVKRSPYNNMTVKIREVDFLGDTATLKGFKTLPLKLYPTSQDLSFQIGDEQIKCTNYWSAFYPNASLTQMDLDMSLDVTLMRHLYYYFRDQHDLKDEHFFESLISLSDLKTTTLKQDVYSLSIQNQSTDYEVCIYRLHPSGSMTYVIDLIKK